jgi:hypothetical protein
VTKHRADLTKGSVLPSTWTSALMEFAGVMVSPNFAVTQVGTSANVLVSAGVGNDQVSIGINGRWRYITAPTAAAAVPVSANTYDVFVTAADNDLSQVDPADNTNYGFLLSVQTPPTVPGTALYRRVATVTTDGTKITRIDSLLPPLSTIGQGIHMADVYASRPAASAVPNGVKFFATDKQMEWQCVAGAWVLTNVIPTQVRQTSNDGIVAFPSGPIDGMEVEFVLDKFRTGPRVWRFRYRTGATAYDASPISQWEFVGGDPLFDRITTLENLTSPTWGDLTTAGPLVIVPVPGTYVIKFGAMDLVDATAITAIVKLTVAINAVAQTNAAVEHHTINPTTVGAGDFPTGGVLMGHLRASVGAGFEVRLKYGNQVNQAFYSARWLRVTPTGA